MNSSLQQFEKSYTRDVSVVMQELWFYGQSQGVEALLGATNPYKPINLYYLNDGAIEVWENIQAVQWLKDHILRKNLNDDQFLMQSLEKYKNILAGMKKQQSSLDRISQLDAFIEQAFVAIPYFVVFYFTAIDERTPAPLHKIALAERDSDTFFDDTDRALRQTLQKLYPKLAGYENTITRAEILLQAMPSLDIAQARSGSFVIIPDEVLEIATLDQFLAKNAQYQIKKGPATSTELTVIHGTVAFRGNAQGIVRIMRRKDQIAEVQQGEIIVAPMTTPDFLPALHKAAAIITDEGGITCHAAIVARELHKPCIIGTKIATQVLYDGDLVEVDANKGMVRVLERAE